jgi:type III secretion protein U
MSEDKKHEASEKRLEDSKKKGQVAVSKDITHLFVTLVMFELVYFTENYWRNAFGNILDGSLKYIVEGIPFKMAFASILWSCLVFFAITSLIVCGISMLISVMSIIAQVGLIFAPEALEIKFDKFNPVNNLKQMFNGRGLFGFVSNVVKALAVTYIVYKVIYASLYVLVLLPLSNVNGVYITILDVLKSIERQSMMIFIPLAAFDFGIQMYFHKKQLMMSDKEVEDEHKESEGDPHVKGERKQFAHEIVFGDDHGGGAPPEADAVIANPSHYAIALSYKPDRYGLPIVLARQADEKARELIQSATDKKIPVIRYIWLARTLYADGTVNRAIPRSTLKAVAFVYRLIRELQAKQADFGKPQEVAAEYTNTDGGDLMAKVMQIQSTDEKSK